MNAYHDLEMRAIAGLRAAGFDAFYHFHVSSLARGVSVRVGKREQRIDWVSEDYVRTPAGFNYSEGASGFTLHAGSVMDEDSAMALITFVSKLVGATDLVMPSAVDEIVDAEDAASSGIEALARAPQQAAEQPSMA